VSGRVRAAAVTAGAALLAIGLAARSASLAQPPTPGSGLGITGESRHASEEVSLHHALVSLPVAAALGAALALRPRRRGTPPRSPAVIQTQIILAVVGALVMLVVGASLARAFGIVGAANLVRYRSKVRDPKDAGVMLSCLALGLAAGVGIYGVAAVSAVFILGVLWVLESFEPERDKGFLLRIRARESPDLQEGIEGVLRKNGVRYELRTSSPDDLTYSVDMPVSKKIDRLTSALQALGHRADMAVEWSDSKSAKDGQ
jgi:hypothetical protein